MRQAGVARMGYMRTPDSQVEKINQYLTLGKESGTYRLFDPCVGEGLALCDVQKSFLTPTQTRYNARFTMYHMQMEEIADDLQKLQIPFEIDEDFYTFSFVNLTEEQKQQVAEINEKNGSAFIVDSVSGNDGESKRNVISYGVELDRARADSASEILDHVVACGYENVRTTKGAFSLMWLNPPYDHTASDENFPSERKELVFLRGTVEYLTTDGILVYIIPQHRLSKEVATSLAWRFEDFAVFRFEDGVYEIYKQIVVICKRKRQSGIKTDAEKTAFRYLRDIGEMKVEPPILGDEAYQEYQWVVPASPIDEKAFSFRGHVLDPKELAKDLERSNVWKNLMPMISLENQKVMGGQPLLPLKTTHLGTIIAAGATDGVIGKGENRHMLVGLTRKVVDKRAEVDDYGNTKEIESERFMSAVKVYTPDGTIKELQ